MQNVEDLYRKKEEAEVEVMGVKFKVRILSGVEYMETVDASMDEQGKPNRTEYAKILIEKCVIEPKVDISKLDATPLVLLLGKLEALHGATSLGELTKKSSMR